MNYSKIGKSIVVFSFLLIIGCGGGGGGGDEQSTTTSTPTTSTPTTPPLQAPDFWQHFSGTTDAVLPSINLPAGIYKISIITSRYAILKEVTTGGSSLLNISAGEASQGAEALFVSDGSSYIFQLSNIGSAWSLVIEHIDLRSPVDITEIGSLNAVGPKIIGPFAVDRSATYLFTMFSNSYFIMVPYSPYTGERGHSIFNQSRGNYGAQTTANFDEDMVLFRVYNVDDTIWSVTAGRL